MARYGQNPQQNIIDMYSPINLELYGSLMNQAQTNLNQGEAMKAKILEDAYGLKHFDEATHKAQIGEIERNVADLTNGDFVSPANVIKGISKASQKFAPYKNLVEKQLEEVKRQQDQKDRWGSNWIGNNVATMGLTDPITGQLISPDRVKGISGNREDLINAIAKDNAGLADKVREIPGGWSTILGGKAYEKRDRKIKGITEEERLTDFVKKEGLAKQYMEQLPGFAEAVKASGMNPEEYIAKEIDTWSKQLVRGEETDSKYMDNPDYGKTTPDSPTTPNTLSVQDTYQIKGQDKEFNLSTIGTLRKRLNEEYKRDPKMRAQFGDIVEANKSMIEMKEKYPDLYDIANNSKSTPKQKADKFLDLVAGAESGRIPSNAKGTVTAQSNRYFINNPESKIGISNAMVIGNPSLEVKSESGEKTTLGALTEANAIPTFKENGDIVLSDTKNNYVWNTSDPKVMSSINTQSHGIIKAQKKLFDNKWATTPDSKPILTEASEVIPGTNYKAKVTYIVVPSNNDNANTFIKAYYVGTLPNGEPDLIFDGDRLVGQEVSFDDVTRMNATALGMINMGKGETNTKAVK